MPTYVYECESCGHGFELFQRFSDEPARTCPTCSGQVRRVFYPVGVIFKGTGWYSTDNRKTGAGSTAKTRASSDGDGKSDVKEDSVASGAGKAEEADKVPSGV